MEYLQSLMWSHKHETVFENRITGRMHEFLVPGGPFSINNAYLNPAIDSLTLSRRTDLNEYTYIEIGNVRDVKEINISTRMVVDGNHSEMKLRGNNMYYADGANPRANEIFNIVMISKLLESLTLKGALTGSFGKGFYARCVPILGREFNIFNISEVIKLAMGAETHDYLMSIHNLGWTESIGILDNASLSSLFSVVEEDKPQVGNDDFHRWMLKRAFTYSKHGTCDRLYVGAIVTIDNEMVGVGFNTALPGKPTCVEAGHQMVDGSCKRTVHAEVNAVLNTIESLGHCNNAVVYCTDEPCSDCLKYMSALGGIEKIYYARAYPRKYEVDTNIELHHITFGH